MSVLPDPTYPIMAPTGLLEGIISALKKLKILLSINLLASLFDSIFFSDSL